MKQYELTFLIHPDLEMNTETVVSKVKDLIDTNGGKVTKETNEGKKRLAYTIKGQDYAVYYYLEAELPAEAPAKISSVLNITDEVLRYLLVAVDERKLKAEAKRAERRAARAEEEQEAQEEKTEEE
ncbi:MAG: 30S ribosomal protein S6 [Bacteroidaceae bacterium]|nr:30S ribosomal protein S6 [Bacteroidaceae bacterium]MBR3595225.1 30S ribosomal protein S6 [Candidatus Saccharibacteria bacterium]MBR6122734.1 30S ribosomal protein S6 [Candidatus Saccharibacteria bacterium]